MSALGYYLEQEGIATVSISLIREHTAALDPPRALWVPFMLGRPVGVPNDPKFQRKVVVAALNLLERDYGPLIEDFPEDAPDEDLGAEPEGLNCPISFPRARSEGSLAERLNDEPIGAVRNADYAKQVLPNGADAEPSAVFDVATRLKRLSLSNNSERAWSMMVFGSATMTLRISVINPPYRVGVTPDKRNLQPERMAKFPP